MCIRDSSYAVVRQIPAGKVASYGQIAEIVGDCTARVVGYAMAAAPDDVPWQRVVNAQGKVSPRADHWGSDCLLYTSPSPLDRNRYRMPSSP